MAKNGKSKSRGSSGWVTLVAILFLIAGFFNLIWGLAAVGVSLGGSDPSVLGDVEGANLEGIGIAGVVIGSLQLIIGAGIWARVEAARVAGLVLAVLAILVNFAYHRILDGWAFSGLFVNALILYILATKDRDFR